MKQDTMFGVDPQYDTPKRPRMAEEDHLHLVIVHGKGDGTCSDCRNLARNKYRAGTYLKCRKARVSRSDATDWRAGWEACGLKE